MNQASFNNRTKPLLSTIIIFLNEEKFLAEAIESVFGQSYDHWELLLVDDGSTDASVGIARKYAQQYPEKVYYLEHEGHQNRGMSASRNLGFRYGRGEYIAFLDADDVWLSHKLERQLAIMVSQPEAAMVYGSPLLWHGWTGRSGDLERDALQPTGVEPNTLVRPSGLLALYLARKAITPCPSDVLLRRQAIEDVGGFEESFPGLYEDQVFFSKVVLEAPVFVSGECWTKHRKHPDSASAIWKRTGEFAFLNWIQKYLESKHVKEPVFRRVLQRRRRRYDHPILFRLAGRARSLMGNSKILLKRLSQRSIPLSR
jgi:glycosyltransferase involved in cell wall biosynthesis